jgi:hypothetical protein
MERWVAKWREGLPIKEVMPVKTWVGSNPYKDLVKSMYGLLKQLRSRLTIERHKIQDKKIRVKFDGKSVIKCAVCACVCRKYRSTQ